MYPPNGDPGHGIRETGRWYHPVAWRIKARRMPCQIYAIARLGKLPSDYAGKSANPRQRIAHQHVDDAATPVQRRDQDCADGLVSHFTN